MQSSIVTAVRTATTLALLGCCLPAWGQSTSKGLRDILPLEVPADLNEEAFESLDGTWTPLRTRLVALVTKLYEDEALDIAGQRQVLDDLRRELGVLQQAMKDEKYRPRWSTLVTLHGRLSRRIAVCNACLEAILADPDPLANERRDLQSALAELDKFLGGLKEEIGDTWVRFLKTRQVSEAAKRPWPTDNDLLLMKEVRWSFDDENQLVDTQQKKFLKKPQFSRFQQMLGTYVAAASRPASSRLPRSVTSPVSAELCARLTPHVSALVKALEEFERTRRRSAAGLARQALKRVQDAAAGPGERLSQALRPCYLDYNLRVVTSEKLLQRLFDREATETGEIVDRVLRAKVSGTQTTRLTATIDLVPNHVGKQNFHPNRAVWTIKITGDIISKTRAKRSGATVFSTGEHRFTAVKTVTFDGDRFFTMAATMPLVEASNEVTRVKAALGLIRRAARRRTEEAKDRIRTIAEGRIRDRVLPRFDRDVNTEFEEASRMLAEHLNGPLKELDLFPSARSITSTDDELRVSTRLMASGELAGSRPNPTVASKTGLVLQLHESVFNNALGRLKLAGKTMTETELQTEIERTISTFLGREYHFDPPKPEAETDSGPTTLIFAEADPVQVRIADGRVSLIIRAGLKQENGKEDIPAQVITIPFTVTIESDRLLVERGSVRVSAVERSKSRAKQIIRAGVVRKKVRGALPLRSLDRRFTIKRNGREPLVLTITRVEALDGWLSLVLE